MTSMPLTLRACWRRSRLAVASMDRSGSKKSEAALHPCRGVERTEVHQLQLRGLMFFSLAYLAAVLLDQRTDVGLVGLVPVGSDVPLPPSHCAMRAQSVPMWLLHEVLTGRMISPKPSAFRAFRRQVQVFKTPAHLLGRQRLALAVLVLRCTDRFDLQHRNHHAAGVRERAHARCRPRTLALVVDQLFQRVVHAVLGGAVVDGDRVVALGARAQVFHVVVRAGPPDGVHFSRG